MSMTVANILTLLRLLLAPLFVAAFIEGEHVLALVLFSVAGFTDLIDGTVARLLKQYSKGGALLDPIADKVLMQSCFIALTASGVLPVWFLAIALIRDVMILSGIFYLERTGAKFRYQPALVSKVATLIQLAVAVMGLVLWWRPEAKILGATLAFWLAIGIAVAAAFIVASAAVYIRLGLEILKSHRGQTG